MAGAEERLWSALRRGDRDDVVASLLDTDPARRRKLRGAVRRHDAAVAASPIGSRLESHWDGELRDGHHSAAVAAVLGCSTLDQAVRVTFTGVADARELPRALFRAELDSFVAHWAERFVRNPEAWDRNRGIEAMFDWAHDQLVQAPVSRGAVLLLSAGFVLGDGLQALRYLEDRPVLIDVTLRRIFDTEGVEGASLAQRDASRPPGAKMVDFVVPELINRDHWSYEFARDGAARALAADLPPHQRRWFTELEDNLRRIGD